MVLAYTAVWSIFPPVGAMCRPQNHTTQLNLSGLAVSRNTYHPLDNEDPGLHARKSSGRALRQNAHRLEPGHRAALCCCVCCINRRNAILRQEASGRPSTAARMPRSSMQRRPTGQAQIARPKWRSAVCAHARQYSAHPRPDLTNRGGKARECCKHSVRREHSLEESNSHVPLPTPATLAITAGL